ncbi:hypothetical protein EXM56_15630, partial [Clostridium botulinum]|nr:hypothetical protein [Clostridium botulinum]
NTMLQHPLDLKYKDNILYIADTYNNRIVKADILNKKVEIIKRRLKPFGSHTINNIRW